MYYSVLYNVNGSGNDVLIFFRNQETDKVLFRIQIPDNLNTKELIEVSTAIIDYIGRKEENKNVKRN